MFVYAVTNSDTGRIVEVHATAEAAEGIITERKLRRHEVMPWPVFGEVPRSVDADVAPTARWADLTDAEIERVFVALDAVLEDDEHPTFRVCQRLKNELKYCLDEREAANRGTGGANGPPKKSVKS